MEAKAEKQTGKSVSPNLVKWSDIEEGSNWSDQLLNSWRSADSCNLGVVALSAIAIVTRPGSMVLITIAVSIAIIILAKSFLGRRENAESTE